MTGKYANGWQMNLARTYRGAMRRLLRGLATWAPLYGPDPGYTLIIGCRSELVGMLHANLYCLQRQDFRHLREVLVVMDRPRKQPVMEIEEAVRKRFPTLPCRFLYYTPTQARLSHMMRWGWVNSWLSWAIGLSEVRTRYAMLHDFDALLLDPDFVENRYEAIRQRGAQYLGPRYYYGNGLSQSDRLTVTFEMMCDVAFVRSRFEPIDLFNHVRMYKGRSVDFDTFLYAQARAGQVSVLEYEPTQMVHPSQMICQFVYHRTGNPKLPGSTNNLMMIPYFLHLGGDASLLLKMTEQLRDREDGCVELFERELDVSPLARKQVDWMEEQMRRVEQTCLGEVRPEVETYIELLRMRALGEHKVTTETEMAPVEG